MADDYNNETNQHQMDQTSNTSILDTNGDLSLRPIPSEKTINYCQNSKFSSILANCSTDPSEFQSTSRSNIYHHHVGISPDSSSSSQSFIHCLDNDDVEQNFHYSGNKCNIKPNIQSKKFNQNNFLNTNIFHTDNHNQENISVIAVTNNSNVLEIERINFNEDHNNESNILNVTNHLNRSTSTNNIDYLLSLLPPSDLNGLTIEDPIQIRGNGNMTLFGLSNCYTSNFPSALLGRVSKEEFEYTINRINHLLQQQHSTNAKFLLLGCLCCCFSLGCSLLWPTFALSKRTKFSLEKVSNLCPINCYFYKILNFSY